MDSAGEGGGSAAGDFLDNDRVFMIHHGQNVGSEVLTSPWETIHRAMAAMDGEPSKVLLKPGGQVSVEVVCVNPRGDEAETARSFKNLVKQRMDGMKVDVVAGAPAVITVTLEEGADSPRPVVTRGLPLDRTEHDTGRTASPAKAVLTLSIHARGSDKNAFVAKWSGSSAGISGGAVTDEGLRRSMLTFLRLRVLSSPLPYFISGEDPALRLPLGETEAEKVPPHFLDPVKDSRPLYEQVIPGRGRPEAEPTTAPAERM